MKTLLPPRPALPTSTSMSVMGWWYVTRWASALAVGSSAFFAPASVCGQAPRPADPSASNLIGDLTSSSAEIRMEAVRQLTQLGRAAVPPLVEALGYTNVDTRVRAASVLGELGSRAVEAVPALTHALEDPSALVRRVAALALGKITPTTPAAVARLIQALGDPDPNVPDNAAWALRALGPAAASRLINALQVTDVKVRRGVAQVLVTGLAIRRSDFAGPQTITALTAALHDADADVRSEATRGLAEIGPPASGALPLLRKLASDDPVVDVRRLATRAVGRIQRP